MCTFYIANIINNDVNVIKCHFGSTFVKNANDVSIIYYYSVSNN